MVVGTRGWLGHWSMLLVVREKKCIITSFPVAGLTKKNLRERRGWKSWNDICRLAISRMLSWRKWVGGNLPMKLWSRWTRLSSRRRWLCSASKVLDASELSELYKCFFGLTQYPVWRESLMLISKKKTYEVATTCNRSKKYLKSTCCAGAGGESSQGCQMHRWKSYTLIYH